MNCFLEFMSETTQYNLRIIAQSMCDQHDKVLSRYKELFIAQFKRVIREECQCLDCNKKESCAKVKTLARGIKDNEINDFFSEIEKSYSYWIDANVRESVTCLEKLLDKAEVFRCEHTYRAQEVYFKGRISQQVLTQWDMFHIPFNRRYLIKNQRYSLTGQPLIYLGTSVLDIAEELEEPKMDELKVSNFVLPKGIRLFDLRNDIDDIIGDIQAKKMLDDEDGKEFTKGNIYKIILSSLCSFQKKDELKGFTFCEEYVIPQIVSQIIKSKQYGGVVYFSTKKFKGVKNSDQNGKVLGDAYKINIAIFTKFTKEHVYDRTLYNNLTPTVPISFNKIDDISIDMLKQVTEEIGKKQNQETITKAELMISSYERNFGNLQINEKGYSETDYGKMHLYQLYIKLNEILSMEVIVS